MHQPDPLPIAIVGVYCRLPGKIYNLDSLWELLTSEVNIVQPVPEVRSELGGFKRRDQNLKLFRGAFLDNIDCYDYPFFNITPLNAEVIDPQHRLFLEAAWSVIEDAGYAPSELKSSRTGVYVGITNYDFNEVLPQEYKERPYGVFGISPSLLANRVSYFLDLYGPSEVVDTACSSSLVCLHRAIQAINASECTQAIVGGVNLILEDSKFFAFSKSGMLSPEGKCKTFDKNADGYVRGEGIISIFIKPLEKAKQDNDYIYGVILSSSVNHGGRSNTLTSPNPQAQTRLINDAISKAGVPLETITYIEAHGTGTKLGDPIEVEALKEVFAPLKATMQNFCGIGSIKTNIGHLEAAAGLAGILKVLACFKYKTLVKNLHFTGINPYINLDSSPFYVVNQNMPWDTSKALSAPRRAGISSFGAGGSNAHVILEEYDNNFPSLQHYGDDFLFFISAKTSQALNQAVLNFKIFLEKEMQRLAVDELPKPLLDAIANTFLYGRDYFNYCQTFIANSSLNLLSQLESYLSKDKHQINAREADIFVSNSKRNLNSKARVRFPLPPYPFERKKCWFNVNKT